MNELLAFAAHNTVAAAVLALFVFVLTRSRRNPPLAHMLWILVLIRLVAPPVMPVEWSALDLSTWNGQRELILANLPRFDRQPAEFHSEIVSEANAHPSSASTANVDLALRTAPLWNRACIALCWLWLGGALVCAFIVATRIVRFERLLRGTLPPSERLQRLAHQVAARLGVRRVPTVRYVECAIVPFLWCAGGRPTIVLPRSLLEQFDDEGSALILAHELAHLRRRDHWVRAVELIVSILYWWNPLVWLIRRRLHEAEDLCCDAWVRWAFPDSTTHYAQVLFETAESVNARQVRARLLPASPFLRSLSLKARIEMILERKFAPRLSTKSMAVAALFGILIVPSFVQTTTVEARAGSGTTAVTMSALPADGPPTSEFPYAVRFQQGATQFLNGDEITITEVRGTADAFSAGNIYCIKGTYTLASHNKAMLAAFLTAKEAKDGKGRYLKVQTTMVDRGSGTFTVFLPMSTQGWPHVSFYPADGGGSFGGNYFGTGEWVLKQWWGSAKTADAGKPHPPTVTEFPHVVPFERGVTEFLNGDKITITEIRGTAKTFAPGNSYKINGTYTLASHNSAMLAAYTTAMDAENGTGPTSKTQSVIVNQGTGTFTLVLPMSCRGWPHLSFYPTDSGQGFGANYFGTGDSVLKRWWGEKETR